MIRYIWFDVGGTLYRETPAFDKVHDQLRYETYAAITGVPMKDAALKYEQLYAQFGSNSAVFTSLGKPSDFWQNTLEKLDMAAVIEPDSTVEETITALSRSIPVSLFTNFKPTKIQAVLQWLSINPDLFTHILSGDDVKNRKPALEGFEKMIELSGLSPQELLYVGDRVDVDLKPAKTLGIQTALIWKISPEADYSAENFPNLMQAIQPDLPS